jgi:hypothetical protein
VAGKVTETGEAVPAEQRVDPTGQAPVVEGYVVFLVPQDPLTGAEVLIAEQLDVDPPPLPKHCQAVVAPLDGKVGATGEDVPLEQKVVPTGQATVVEG